MICGSRRSKSRLAEAAGAETCGQMRDELCIAKHISKSKCTKHLSLGALLEVATSKKCTPLWREADFHSLKVIIRSCDVEKVHAIVARRTFASQKLEKN